jgi:hypothetical protein
MAIIYGTGTYTMKRFSASDLGIMSSDLDGYEFHIMKRYAHLYWIPIFSLGTLYVTSKPGSSDKYEVSEGLKNVMQAHDVPFWKHLGAFALPLIAILGYSYFQVQESAENARYQQSYNAKMAETTQAMADTAALRPYANQFIALLSCLEKSEEEKIVPVKKIDTTESKIFVLMLKCLTTDRDTTIPYTRENTFICTPHLDANSKTLQAAEEGDLLQRNKKYFYSNDMSILQWYYSGFKDAPPSNDAYRVDNINKINATLNQYKYIATIRYTGFAHPSLDIANERFQAGYILAKIYVYEVASKKLVEKYEILSSNSESISYRSRKGESISSTDMDSRLMTDLQRNLHHQILVSLRLATGEYTPDSRLIF